jgi:phosphoribosylformimino-5-aminoimidazole carboxamide ribotide isomerase
VLILPAIDLRGGRCVRLRQGDYQQETIFGDDPAAVAFRWVSEGATYLHLVDLDGAKEGRPVNTESVRRILAAAKVPCQLGGGLRTEAHIVEALELGLDRVVIGTKALKDPVWFEAVSRRYPNKLVLGIDAKQGQVATDGWLEVSHQSAIDLARQCDSWPLSAIVYTDISRDGMMEGPNVDGVEQFVASLRLPVIASGGVSCLEDLRRLAKANPAGCIVGRALYEGKFSLVEALGVVNCKH